MDEELKRAAELVALYNSIAKEIEELLEQDPRVIGELLTEKNTRGSPVNITTWIKSALEARRYEDVVEAWEYLEKTKANESLAVLRTTLNRESKKVFGRPVAVIDGDLV